MVTQGLSGSLADLHGQSVSFKGLVLVSYGPSAESATADQYDYEYGHHRTMICFTCLACCNRTDLFCMYFLVFISLGSGYVEPRFTRVKILKFAFTPPVPNFYWPQILFLNFFFQPKFFFKTQNILGPIDF